jgi:hypothetical protein
MRRLTRLDSKLALVLPLMAASPGLRRRVLRAMGKQKRLARRRPQ